MKTFEEFTGLYPVKKTLRCELRPLGRTLEHIETKGLIAEDEQRNEECEKVKKIIDEYHKLFIKTCLNNFKLKLYSDEELDSLEEYVAYASMAKRDEKENAAFEKVKENLRKQIVGAFKAGDTFGGLFKEKLIQQYLPEFVKDSDDRKMVENFNKFTTYFTGFQKNRKNMYSDEAKSTAIAYRLIHENLPMFLDNMKTFAIVAGSSVSEHFAQVEKDFEEHLNVEKVNDVFQLDYFTDTLTQEQIEVYNALIGGRVLNDGTKLQGLNEYINLYNQQQKERNDRLPLLKPLYKMILSDRVAISWLPEEFTCDGDMVKAIGEMYESLKDVLMGDNEASLRSLLKNIKAYDLDHIYIANDLGLTDISQHLFGQYDVYTVGVKRDLRSQAASTPKEKRNPELYEERINKLFKGGKSFSIAYLNSLPKPEQDGLNTIEDYFAQMGAYSRHEDEQRVNLFKQIEMTYVAAEDVLSGKRTNLNQDEEAIRLIKELLDSFKDLQHFIKPLLGSGDETDKDNVFDARLRAAWDALDIVTPLYNKVRNWLTRKPYNTEKIKLNFANAQLMSGWDLNKETDNTSVLLRKDGMYYLAIMDKHYNRAFDMDELPCDGECYEKVDYKQIALPMGMGAFVRKCFGSAMKLGWNCPSKFLTREGKIIIKDEDAKDCLPELIDCYKDFLNIYEKDGFKYKRFGFKFKPSSEYEKLSQFFAEIPQQGYMLGYRSVSVAYIKQLVDEGKLYLFQIWNKDFSEHSKGTPNMHTLYWKMLFDERNLANVVYKLNGQAEVFYRKRSLDLAKTTVHKAHTPIKNKNDQAEKKTSTFDYDIIKNRRYTVDKFQFHVPITMNFKAVGTGLINAAVQESIRSGAIQHIIGIDRGERHLLYFSLIDLKGRIVDQKTLNDIASKGSVTPTNYKDLLAAREGDRKEARQNWQKIENIKELKEGYLSQVVHIITKMMVEYKAVVVLEDLNMGFMRGRQKIERQVYAKFEKMLIDKLNYYVDKQKAPEEPGGLLNAFQLTNDPKVVKGNPKQSGCLFYIPAWNTSKIDPVTGFVNLLDSRDLNYESVEKAQNFFFKFDSIRYNLSKDWFEFALDYSKFGNKADGSQTKWTLCTHGTRIRTFRNPAKNNQWDNEEINLTEAFKQVFAEAGININGNLKDSICSLAEKKYLEHLIHLMKLLLQMRNSVTGTEVDYMISPVADAQGNFYDSRICDDSLPQDADANGAYNIARKGLWALRKIQASKPDDKISLAITNKEWLQFAQKRPYLDD